MHQKIKYNYINFRYNVSNIYLRVSDQIDLHNSRKDAIESLIPISNYIFCFNNISRKAQSLYR